jgi:hypothetical protein
MYRLSQTWTYAGGDPEFFESKVAHLRSLLGQGRIEIHENDPEDPSSFGDYVE